MAIVAQIMPKSACGYGPLKISISIDENAQYFLQCTKVQTMYLLIKIIILTNFDIISKVVESLSSCLMGTP